MDDLPAVTGPDRVDRTPRRFRILLLAFGCDPSRGSEWGIGWNWALHLARAGHQVHVLTTPGGKETIEAFLKASPLTSLTVVYIDRPSIAPRLMPFGYQLMYKRWQKRALQAARRLSAEVPFDLVHHVSFGSLHAGSELWRLGKPFVFGPVGGGQTVPRGFRRYLRGGWLTATLRSILVRYFTGSLFPAGTTVRNADLTLVANFETRDWVKRLGGKRIEFMPSAGVPRSWLADAPPAPSPGPLRIVWVGRLFPRKAVLLSLHALSLVDPDVAFTCTIVGNGMQGRYLPKWIEALKLGDRVTWKGTVPFSEMMNTYSGHDVFLFSSLQDTDGNQLIEAMARGNAIVALDHQGTAAIVPDSAGIKVPVTTPDETAAELARALERLAREPETLASMKRNAILCAASHTYEQKVARATEFYPEIVQAAADPDRS